MITKATRHWGLFIIGIILLIVGFIMIWWPVESAFGVATVAGIVLAVAGVYDLIFYIGYRRQLELSGWTLVYAICDIVLGVLFILNPIISAVVIPLVAGVFLCVYGIVEIIAGIRARGISGRAWTVFAGIIDILCAIFFWIVPDFFYLFLAFFFIMQGVSLAVFGATKIRTPQV
ncbi:MAG: DUF308 domain-containing protein [Eggerthellaceae bacterium]|nr:DUF308 domain-containing protein [Eggerthellaceae bacterium]